MVLSPVLPQNEPALQAVGDGMPFELQNEPRGHAVATEAPTGQYVVARHCVCVNDDEPVGHMKPP